MKLTTTIPVLCEIEAERRRQDEKWGTQSHPSRGQTSPSMWEASANGQRIRNDLDASRGELTWEGILLEEVYEALAETNLSKRRAELVQVAAVAVAEIECIDRKVVAA